MNEKLKNGNKVLFEECDKLFRGYCGTTKMLDKIHKTNPELLPSNYKELDVEGFGTYHFK